MSYEVLKDKSLALFFSCGVSLKTWQEIGSLEREVAVYNELAKYFSRIFFFTYGDKEDLKFGSYLAPNITVIPGKYCTSGPGYSLILPVVRYRILKTIDIFKTNQMWGAWSPAIAKIFFRKKLVARTGYMWSVNYAREYPGSWKLKPITWLEKFVYRRADAAITSSPSNYQYVQTQYHPRNHTCIANYIETDIFKPLGLPRERGSICFVGSLYNVKNPAALLEAIEGLPYAVTFVGSGTLAAQLQEMARDKKIHAEFPGNIPNHQLPEILNRHEVFVLPSLWEGMPKTLLEAMACGLAVIGTDVPGNNEVITDGFDGVLCRTDAASIREAIVKLMNDRALREKLGANARKTIEEKYSFDKLVTQELELYASLFARGTFKE